jgi:hypothetical protein
MGLSKRQEHHSVTKRHARRFRRRRTAAVTGRRPTSSGRFRSQNGRRSTPVAMPPIHSDTVRQVAALPHHSYPPRFDRAAVSFSFAPRHTSCQPDFFSPDLRLLRRDGGNRLLIESGAAVTRLVDPRDDPGPDTTRPAGRAHELARRMLVDLGNLNFNIPATDVYSDPDGAIRLLWTREDRNVELVLPSIENEAPYLYHSDEHNYGVEEHPSPECALKWINWVLDNESPGHVRAA